jgi:restriction endonuclease S subunit
MKEGWKTKELGDICDILDKKRKPITKKDRIAGDFPYYGATGILDYVHDYIFDEKLILVGEDGAKWGPGEGSAFSAEGYYWVNNHAHVIRPFRDCLIDAWLIHYLNFSDLSPFISGLTVPKLNQGKLRIIPIPLPPLAEQRRLVGILDEVFAGLDQAVATAERNLASARELFDSELNAVFSQKGEGWVEKTCQRSGTVDSRISQLNPASHKPAGTNVLDDGKHVTKTKGRAATTSHIPGALSLSVGMPKNPSRPGWKWTKLTEIARLESGHTPSRRHPEYWGGNIPWIGIKDARKYHGWKINKTMQHTNELGIENSSARVLPAGTVCLSRTASVGYIVVMSCPMATSQDFVNWVCSDQLEAEFLKYLLMAEGKEILRFASGSVHQTIYFPEVKAFHICCPNITEQQRIVNLLDFSRAETRRLETIYQRKLAALAELRQSILEKAFSGELSGRPEQAKQPEFDLV